MHANNPETIYSAASGDWTQARLITVSGSARTVPMSHRDKQIQAIHCMKTVGDAARDSVRTIQIIPPFLPFSCPFSFCSSFSPFPILSIVIQLGERWKLKKWLKSSIRGWNRPVVFRGEGLCLSVVMPLQEAVDIGRGSASWKWPVAYVWPEVSLKISSRLLHSELHAKNVQYIYAI